MTSLLNNRCAFCNQQSDRLCPIVGKKICSTTCLEICLWSDEVILNEDRVYLEFINRIRIYSKLELGLVSDIEIANKCKGCEYHWNDVN